MIIDLLTYFLGPLVVISLALGALLLLNWLFTNYLFKQSEKKIHKQALMLFATTLLLIVVIVLLPIGDTLRGQIFSLLGILLSAAIALSSTTFLGNALAGILLRNVRSFRVGDFIYINDLFGRVSGRGLFHLEIQTADRDLLTVPNLYVTNNAVKVTRDSGTIVSTEVSLGYDIPRGRVEELLLHAARGAGLEDPFVYISRLGDFSVVYQVKGLLTDVKRLLSAKSSLNGQVLDSLHAAEIEIVSPNFMNTRNVEQTYFIPSMIRDVPKVYPDKQPEEMVFDKAEQAEGLEELKEQLAKVAEELEQIEQAEASASDQEKGQLVQQQDQLEKRYQLLSKKISGVERELGSEKGNID